MFHVRHLSIIGVIATLAIVFLTIPLGAIAADPPANVTIKVIQDKQAPVNFPHKAHQAKLQGKCANCHANASGDGGLKPEFAQKPANMGAAMKHPFHKQCLDCHKASGNAKAPTKCGDCHK
jgi:hypothetical protein